MPPRQMRSLRQSERIWRGCARHPFVEFRLFDDARKRLPCPRLSHHMYTPHIHTTSASAHVVTRCEHNVGE